MNCWADLKRWWQDIGVCEHVMCAHVCVHTRAHMHIYTCIYSTMPCLFFLAPCFAENFLFSLNTRIYVTVNRIGLMSIFRFLTRVSSSYRHAVSLFCVYVYVFVCVCCACVRMYVTVIRCLLPLRKVVIILNSHAKPQTIGSNFLDVALLLLINFCFKSIS